MSGACVPSFLDADEARVNEDIYILVGGSAREIAHSARKITTNAGTARIEWVLGSDPADATRVWIIV